MEGKLIKSSCTFNFAKSPKGREHLPILVSVSYVIGNDHCRVRVWDSISSKRLSKEMSYWPTDFEEAARIAEFVLSNYWQEAK